ncbi:MAG: hypothetical protein J3T61_07125 [Candidatus Brocadiales bacterium]|nr:hypothetical protein [Candidatus Bathyanammoxibius sp.]
MVLHNGPVVRNPGILATVDINGGTIDDATIGATTATTIKGTTIDATTDFTIGATIITDGVLTDAGGIQMAAVLDMANNAVNNIGAAGNDFGADILEMQTAVVGGDKSVLVVNSDNTNTASDALVDIRNGGTSGGDPKVEFTIGGTQNWHIGVDNSASDVLTIGPNDAPGGQDGMRMTVANPAVVSFDTTLGGDFDYVCESCGDHKAKPFTCCGTVSWHDDVRAISPGIFMADGHTVPEVVDELAKIGVLYRSVSNSGRKEVFVNIQPAIMFGWDMARQNRARMDAQYEQFNKRLEAIGA